MTVTVIDGKINHSKNEVEELIRQYCIGGFYFEGFESKDEAELFISKFPKYVKLYHGTMLYLHGELNGLTKDVVKFNISALNNVTGEMNETGEKRIKGLLDALDKNNMLVK